MNKTWVMELEYSIFKKNFKFDYFIYNFYFYSYSDLSFQTFAKTLFFFFFLKEKKKSI
jgi:hypothetical protein